MTEHRKELLATLSKEQLIYIIDQMYRSLFMITETCVDESKRHIESTYAVEKIRGYIYDMPSAYNEKDFKDRLDFEMGKITLPELIKRRNEYE